MKYWSELENFQKFVVSRSEYVCYARIGRPDTFMVGRSPDACYHKVVTNTWSDWFPTFISELSKDNIYMLATSLSIVVTAFSRTLILQGDLKDSKIQVSHIRFEQLDVQTENRGFHRAAPKRKSSQ